MMLERNDVLVGKKFKEFFFPSVLMAMSASLSIIVDSMIVGNVLGDRELAAMNLIMPLSLCFTAVTAIFGIGSSTCISVFKGKMDDRRADKCLTLSCIAWIGCSMIGVFLGLFATDPIAAFLSGSSGLTELTADYLRVYLIGSPFTFVTMIFPHIIRVDGKPKLASNVLIIANAVNLILDVVYMKYMGMGLEGGALATISGYALGTLIYLSYAFSKERNLHLSGIASADFRVYIDMVKMSVASISGQGFMFAKIWIFNMIVASVAGQAGLTAFSVCTSCLSFVSMFIAGASQTMMPMVAAFKGAEDHTAIGMTIRRALKVIIGCCLATTVLFEIFPGTVLGLFGVTGGESLSIGIVAVRLFSITLTGIGITFLYMYYMQASGRPGFSMMICALEGFFVIVPVALLLAWQMGINGFWLAYTVNELIVIIIIYIKARRTVKKSQGELFSVFMLNKPESGTLELSVDVSEPEMICEAIERMEKAADKDAAEALQCIFDLSRRGYEEKHGLKKGAMADVIKTGNRISFKDMGKDHSSLRREDIFEKMIAMDISFEHTLMIGMNYAKFKTKEV